MSDELIVRVCPTDTKMKEIIDSIKTRGLNVKAELVRGTWEPYLFVGKHKLSGRDEVSEYLQYRLSKAS